MIDDRTNRDFLFITRSRSKRGMMNIVHRAPSTSSSSESGEEQQQQQKLIHSVVERRSRSSSHDDSSSGNNNRNSGGGGGGGGSYRNNKTLTSSSNNNNGKSRTVHMIGIFSIAAVCLILSLGFFSSDNNATDASVESSSSTLTTPINLPKTMSKPQTTIKNAQRDNDDDVSDDDSGLTEEELMAMIADLAGSDKRIMRWNAQKHTVKRQQQGGCNQLRQALDILALKNNPKDHNLSTPSLTRRKQLAAEFVTFCITDNPIHREMFSNYHVNDDDIDGTALHLAIVDLVMVGVAAANQIATNQHDENEDNHEPYHDDVARMASAMAAHLIYIASFSNTKNQQTFFQQFALDALAKVVMNKNSLPVQVMWAAAALQNLAASYCATGEHDGRCYWDWNSPQDDHVTISPDSLPIVSDGTLIRQQILQIDGLVQALTDWACTGPVHGQASDTNIFPGENGQVGRDETNPNIVAWAATGALKNLALEPTAKAAIEPSMSCLCRLKKSPDWLEKLKAKDALHFMRRGSHPCWFNSKSSSSLCIDDNFIDAQEYSCDGYRNPQPDDCNIPDAQIPSITASQACCTCGGGTKVEKSAGSR